MRAALLALCLLLAACAAPAPGVQPESPLWAVSPLTARPAVQRYRVALPIVEGQNYTAHCTALDTWAATGSVAAQLATVGEGECFHVWWTPTPLPDGLWPACRSVSECEALDVARIARERPGATVLLLNEPNNPDIAGGGWPVAPDVAAGRLRNVVARLRQSGLAAACCGLYFDASDSLGGVRWWRAYVAAGGRSDVRHYHVFGLTRQDAIATRAKAERAMPPPWIVSESGWTCAVAQVVNGIDSARYHAAFVLHSARCE